MLVTLMTDASYCPNTMVAGYGFWIASDRGKLAGGGAMTTRGILNSTVAEMMAIANSLHCALVADLVQHGDLVLVQTDSMGAIERFETGIAGMGKTEVMVRQYVLRTATAYALSLTFRHVKGHSWRRDPRYVANNHCDERAKYHMRKLRDQVRKNGQQAQ